MTQRLTFLNSKELKHLREMMISQFGYFPKEDYAYLQTEKDKLFLISKDLIKVDLKKLIVDKVGLYFAEVKNNRVRLSKEGAQLLGVSSRKHGGQLQNTVLLTDEELQLYFTGKDLEKDVGAENKLVLLQYGQDVLGCAQYKDGKILNFMPKTSRGEVIL